jgi:hypothetical protein
VQQGVAASRSVRPRIFEDGIDPESVHDVEKCEVQ